jgi:hypothetical protein
MQPHETELWREFLDNFKLMFNNDWEYTKSMIKQDNAELITGDGTFLEPGVESESDGWANRSALLESYRELVDYLKENELVEADY